MPRGKTSESVVRKGGKYYPPKDFKNKAGVRSLREHQRLCRESVRHPEAFRAERAERLAWIKRGIERLIKEREA